MPRIATRKAQVVLSADQYELLEAHAREQGTTVSAVVREALEQSLLARLEQQRREEAVHWLCSQDLPIDDWEVIERELETRWEEHEPD